MNPSFFAAFSLFLVAVMSVAHTEIIKEFRSGKQERLLIENLQANLEGERLKYKALHSDHLSLQHDVARVLPGHLENLGGDPEKSYPLRNLASVLFTSTTLQALGDEQEQKLATAKEEFREGRYDRAIETLKDFIGRYETSSRVVEAKFLLAESYFQQQEYESSLDLINQMLTLHPESELTGFLLLRLGAIFEDQNKDLDAIGVYKTITKNFNNKDLLFQAERNLQRLSL